MKQSCLPYSRLEWFLFAGIVLLAAALRLYHIQYVTNVDEPNVVTRALQVADGAWHIPWYNWPAQTLIRIDGAVFALIQMFWHGAGTAVFYTAAHVVTVAFALVSVVLIAAITYKLYPSKLASLLAAFFLAINYLHGLHSRFATPDVPMTAAFLASVYLALLYVRSRDLTHERWLIVGMGAVTGFAIATKYTGALAFMPFVVAYMLRWCSEDRVHKWNPKHLLPLAWFGCALILMHTLCNPYFLTDLSVVRAAFAVEANPSRLGVDWGGAGNVFTKNVLYYLNSSFAWNGTVITAVAYITMLWSLVRVRSAQYRDALIPLVLFVAVLVGLSMLGLHWSRWAVPLSPFVVAFGAIGLARMFDVVAKRTQSKKLLYAIGMVLLVVVSFPQFMISMATAASFNQPDTTDRLSSYIQQHVPEGAHIVGDTYFVDPGQTRSIKEPGIDVYKHSLAEYKQQGVSYVVIKPDRLGDAKKQPKQYAYVIDFFASLETSATKLETFRAKGDPLLEHKRDYGVYRWLYKHRNQKDLFRIEQGDTFVLYAIK